MDDSVVTVGLKGSRVALVATGGNSPLAEMRKIHRTYETVTWFLIRTIDVYRKRCPPPTPYTALLWAQTSTVAPPVGPRSLTFLCPAIRWVSVGTARLLMQFHNTQQHLALSSRPPAARVAEAAHRGSVASSAFQ